MRLKFPESVVFREEPGGAILFNADTGDMRIVEGVAWGICHLIDGGSTRQDVLEELKKLYPEQDSLKEDLDGFIADLQGSGMLEIHRR